MNDQVFCAWPWFHQRIAPNGIATPCCAWAGDKPKYNHNTFLHSDFMENLRREFATGKPATDSCNQCLYHEKLGKYSQRLISFNLARELDVDLSQPAKLRSQEVNLSNVCNLKCRTCSPDRSTKWNADAEAAGYIKRGLVESNWDLDNCVDDIKIIMFLGGEPLMHQDQIIDNLKKIQDRGKLHELTLYFTTNATLRINDELLELLLKTKLTQILCSIDAYGELNDYIRSDSKWSEIEDNMRFLCQIRDKFNNFVVRVNSVISVFNAERYYELVQWCIDMKLHCDCSPCSWPKIHDARNLPSEYKERIINNYAIIRETIPVDRTKPIDLVIQHLKNEALLDQSTWKNNFIKHNFALDDRRSVRLQDYVSSLSEIVGGM